MFATHAMAVAGGGGGGGGYIPLLETAGEISANWLCQNLVWSLYQMSHCDHTCMVKEVWPFVVQDITQDEHIVTGFYPSPKILLVLYSCE